MFNNKKQVKVSLNRILYGELRVYSRKNGMTMTEAIRKALEHFLKVNYENDEFKN